MTSTPTPAPKLTKEEAIAIIMAAEYADSGMYERTDAALSKLKGTK